MAFQQGVHLKELLKKDISENFYYRLRPTCQAVLHFYERKLLPMDYSSQEFKV